MPDLAPVSRRSLPDAVFDQIAARIVDGDLEPGASLPSERRLAEVLGVSRPALREALQRLAAAGLVTIRQGDATTVRDYRRTAGMDLLPRLLVLGAGVDLDVARDVVDLRLVIGPHAARRAAERAGRALEGPLRSSVQELGSTDDPVALQRAALGFWDVVVDGAQSVVLSLLWNALRAAYAPLLDVLADAMVAEVGDHGAYARLAAAVVVGDGGAAEGAARDLLLLGTGAVTGVLDRLADGGATS